MQETDKLTEVRERLKTHMAQGEHVAIIGFILNRVNRIFRRPPGKSLSVQTSALFFVLICLSLSTLILFAMEPAQQSLTDLVMLLPLVLIIYLGVVGTQKYWQLVFSTFSTHVVDAIVSIDDLRDLEDWLDNLSKYGKQLAWGLFFTFVFETYFLVAALVTGTVAPRLAVFLAFGIFIFQVGLLFYDFILALNLPLRLKNYQFKLYSADPSSSGVVEKLSGMLFSFLFLVAALTGLVTLLMAFFNPLEVAGVIFVLFLAWGPLFLTFTVNQSALKRIITNSKQKALSDIQAQIEKLQASEEIPGTETLAHIRALMDYHDYVKSRRGSMLDVQAGLNFLNSLLFPVIGFLLGNLRELIAFFTK